MKIDVREAIKRGGGPDRVADAMGLHRTAVYRWLWANALPGSRKLERLKASLSAAAGVKPAALMTHQPDSTD